MTEKRLSPVEWKSFLGFAVALSILLMIGAMAIRFLNQAKEAERWIEHTHDVIDHLEACQMADREMESTARSFVLNGQNKYLQNYLQSVKRLEEAIQAVEHLTKDNPVQRQRISTDLHPMVAKRLAMATRVIDARRRMGQQAAIAILFERNVLKLIGDIHQVIARIQNEERSLLRMRMIKQAESSRKLQSSVLLGSAVAIIFLAIASVLIHRDHLARFLIEQELRRSEASLKKQTEELRAINKELESFSYSVSHDLRAPLRGIEGFSELIRETYKDRLDAEGQGYFERVSSAARRMGILIDEILNLSRIARSPLEKQPIDLAVIARDIAHDMEKSEPERKVRWTTPKTLPALGDPSLLHIAIMNLIANAWKFTSKLKETHIEIGSELKEGETVYFVKDNGAGFDMTYQNKLFQAFQRLHTVKEYPGTGIGLATVQRVIHRHGGRVWAEGAVGQGAAFYFTL